MQHVNSGVTAGKRKPDLPSLSRSASEDGLSKLESFRIGVQPKFHSTPIMKNRGKGRRKSKSSKLKPDRVEKDSEIGSEESSS